MKALLLSPWTAEGRDLLVRRIAERLRGTRILRRRRTNDMRKAVAILACCRRCRQLFPPP